MKNIICKLLNHNWKAKGYIFSLYVKKRYKGCVSVPGITCKRCGEEMMPTWTDWTSGEGKLKTDFLPLLKAYYKVNKKA